LSVKRVNDTTNELVSADFNLIERMEMNMQTVFEFAKEDPTSVTDGFEVQRYNLALELNQEKTKIVYCRNNRKR
jgi:hypothetical protein